MNNHLSCVSVCVLVCVGRISQEFINGFYEMKFYKGVRRAQRKNRLDFGGDLDSFVDPGSFCRILYSSSLRDRTYRGRCCHLPNVYELMYATQPTLASSSSLASAEVHALYRVLSSLQLQQ